MSSADHLYGQVPAPMPQMKAPVAFDLDDLQGDPTGGVATPRRFNARLIWRALKRHWWQALTVWAIASAALMVVAYYKVKPTYDAWSQISVQQAQEKIFGGVANNNDFEAFKETQVRMMTFPNVLEAALGAHPELLSLPMLARSEEPKDEIRRNLIVGIIPRTNLINVGLISEHPHEAVAIVNAVVDAYLKTALDKGFDDEARRIQRLREARDERQLEVDQLRKKIEDMQQEFGFNNEQKVKDRDTVTLESYSMLNNELLSVQIDRAAAEEALNQLRQDRPGASSMVAAPPQAAREQQVRELFFANPRVVANRDKFDQEKAAYEKAKRAARNPNGDPAAQYHKKAMSGLDDELALLWRKLEPQISAQIDEPGVVGEADTDYERRLAEAERVHRALVAREKALEERLQNLQAKDRRDGQDALKLEFARADLERAYKVLAAVQSALDQAEFDAKSPLARIRREFAAKPSNKPSSNHRMKVIALAPFAVMCLIVGTLVLVELQAGRVADPDEVPGRLRLQVLGVVPPLPQIKAPSALEHGRGGELVESHAYRGDDRAQRQLDEFVQSLDHLRVALCSGGPDGRARRCLLITSACGSEGKTTLAAQLAERCVNAGLMTLLVDGDLRNPTLSRVLDVADNRGLINVLRDEITTEEALTVIGGAGGFHLLPAGTPRMDPSRLLQGERLGKVLAQVRESFDIVIVDAPPVLPVPDALTMGRWTDGAVLAVRYDTSRFPLVERANRRLASVGVPVIGAVVNGVKSSNSSYYGSYYPAGASALDESAMLDV